MFDTALVLRVGKFREYDAWVRLLTREHGICTAFAFGASKSRRRFAGCLDTLNIVNVSIEKSRKKDFLQLQEASLLNSFNLRSDWRLLGIATNCLRFIEALEIAPETSVASYDFINAFFEALVPYQEHHQRSAHLPPLFRFKLASIQGYAPHMHSCVRCNIDFDESNHHSNIFSVQEGGVICKSCAQKSFASSSMHIPITKYTLLFLQKVQSEHISTWLEETIPPYAMNEYAKIIDAFVQYHLNLEWKYNRFVQI